MRGEAGVEIDAETTCGRVGMRDEAGVTVQTAVEVNAATTCRRAGMQGEAAVTSEAATTCGRVGMQAEAVLEAEATPTWAHGHEVNPDWHTVDRALRAIAQRRAVLDADEARWLRQRGLDG